MNYCVIVAPHGVCAYTTFDDALRAFQDAPVESRLEFAVSDEHLRRFYPQAEVVA